MPRDKEQALQSLPCSTNTNYATSYSTDIKIPVCEKIPFKNVRYYLTVKSNPR